MEAEISYDLVMNDNMSFIEGMYRLPNREWQVVIVYRKEVEKVEIVPQIWQSGATGVVIYFPMTGLPINQTNVQYYLSNTTGVTKWIEVCGPDSMKLR